MKKGFVNTIDALTLKNNSFRKVLYTTKHCQLVLMSIVPGGEIGSEVHEDGDQFFRFEEGTGKVVIDDTEYMVAAGDAVVVPAGATHNVINTSDCEPLKLYTIYTPPHHKDGIERATKEDTVANSPEFDGVTTEQ